MMPREGKVQLLRLLCEQPMNLAVFVAGPKNGVDIVSAVDFNLAGSTSPHSLAFRDWLIDEENLVAKADKRTFSFKSTGEKIAGWCLTTKKDRVVVGYHNFEEPYTINSVEDTVGVRPILRTK